MPVMVRYKVKRDRGDENAAAVRDVFAALERERPAGLRYVTLRAADGATFVHFAVIETDDGSNPLFAVDAFKRFADGVKERCEEPPVTTQCEVVGSYRMFGRAVEAK